MPAICGGLRYDFAGDDADVEAANSHQLDQRSFNEACDYLRSNIIGSDAVIVTPFGRRQVLYADYTASGRSLRCIEDFMTSEVLPLYGNTHTLANATGSQTTLFRVEARQVIKQYFNATHDDALVFCGSGSTVRTSHFESSLCHAAVHKFIAIMQQSCWDVRPEALRNTTPKGRCDFFAEDRWGSCECTLCGIKLKNEALFRAHQHSGGHQARLAQQQKSKFFEKGIHQQATEKSPIDSQFELQKPSDTSSGHITRLIVFLCDPTAHHSLSLPFRELAKSPSSQRQHVLSNEKASVSFDQIDLRMDTHTCRFDEANLLSELISCQTLQQKAEEAEKSIAFDSATTTPKFEVVPVAILSAGSNVTGLQNNVAEINSLVHKYGGVCCWDFAATSAHSKVDFNPADKADAFIDVGFFSPHKLLGGPGCPGMLIMKKNLLRNTIPSHPGGGVVYYVSSNGHSYIHNSEEKEEGGTPDILADIRSGLVFRLHSTLSPLHIAMREYAFTEYLIKNWSKHHRIQLLGPCDIKSTPSTSREHFLCRMGILSFMIKYGNIQECSEDNKKMKATGLYLHHQFVVSLLNDLFGVQVRGGCACAGPLAQYLLGIPQQLSDRIEDCLQKTGQEALRPGFVRASLHYSMSWDDIELLCQSVLWIADFGWQFLPAYTFTPETGEWHHRVKKPKTQRKWLSGLTLTKQKGVGMTAIVDGRMGQQGRTQQEADVSEIPLPKKDPKRIAGAVALLPGADVDQASFKLNIQKTLGNLKKSSKPQNSTMNTPIAEDLKPKLKSAEDGRLIRETREAAKVSGGNELSRMLSLRKAAVDEGERLAKNAKSESHSRITSKTTNPSTSDYTPHQSETKISVDVKEVPNDVRDLPTLNKNKTSTTALGSRGCDDKEVSLYERAVYHGVFSDSNHQKTLFNIYEKQAILHSIQQKKQQQLVVKKVGNDSSSVVLEKPQSQSPIVVAKKLSQTVDLQYTLDNNERLLKSSNIIGSQSKEGLESLFVSETIPTTLEEIMAFNHEILETLYSGGRKNVLSNQVSVPPLPSDSAQYLWFALPVDAAQSLLKGNGKPSLADDKLLGFISTGTATNSSQRPKMSCFEVRHFSDAPSLKEHTTVEIFDQPQVLTKQVTDPALLHRLTASMRQMNETTESLAFNRTSNLLDVMKTGLLVMRSEPQMPRQNSNQKVFDTSPADKSPDADISDPNTEELLDSEIDGGPKKCKDGLLEIPRQLRRTVGSAIKDFDMIKEGDRLLIGLSGGKDSLSMLHVLRDAQKRSPIKFEIFAATVDPQTSEYDPSPLISYMKSLGIKYHFLSYPLIELAKTHMQKNSICAFCSRMKRGILYSCMRSNNYNVLVLGQHLDDICESFIMSALHNGSLNTMKAHYKIGNENIRVCRPLIYTREKMLYQFARNAHLPVISDNCPACFSQPKERHRIKLLLAQQEYEYPHIFQTLLQTVKPLISIQVVDKQQINDKELYENSLDTLTQALMNGTDQNLEKDIMSACADEVLDFKAEQVLTNCSTGVCHNISSTLELHEQTKNCN